MKSNVRHRAVHPPINVKPSAVKIKRKGVHHKCVSQNLESNS
jgi:uncharacterized protein (UPF0305 family)